MAVQLIMRPPSAAFQRALSAHPERDRIDPAQAAVEHALYVQALRSRRLTVTVLPPDPDLPDACFTWDTVLAFPGKGSTERTGLLVACRPGEPARRPEVAPVLACARALAGDGVPVVEIEPPGTLDGGDVIMFDGLVAIGVSPRTNSEGADQLATAVERIGYQAVSCPVRGYLHLASAVTPLGGRRAIGTPLGFAMLEAGGVTASSIDRIAIAEEDVVGANVLAVGGTCFMAAGVPRAAAALRQAGFSVVELDLRDFTRADGGPTCLVAPVFTSPNREESLGSGRPR